MSDLGRPEVLGARGEPPGVVGDQRDAEVACPGIAILGGVAHLESTERRTGAKAREERGALLARRREKGIEERQLQPLISGPRKRRARAEERAQRRRLRQRSVERAKRQP